jgi:predicted kinase
MGVIVNPRGTSGSGKTELARRLLADYGWGRDGRAEPIRRTGRARPLGYRLRHPRGGRPLAVLGHYEATSGGCDTIRATDGGMDEAFRLADEYASTGHGVLLEGLVLSGEHTRSAALAKANQLHVLRLSTPLDRCIRNVIARQRAGRRNWASIVRTATMQQANIEEACRQLRPHASVELLDFGGALLRARELLGLEEPWAAA